MVTADVTQPCKHVLAAPHAPAPGPAQIAWVHVPAGAFMMGSELATDEKPVHLVYLDEYWIAQTPVTVAQFARFVAATRYVTTAEHEGWGYVWRQTHGQWCLDKVSGANWRAPHGRLLDVQARGAHPVVQVTWDDAQAFCAWAGCVLPTEAEWEKAARGTDQRVYPWGNEFDAMRCNTVEGGVGDTTPVERYGALGASQYGVWDMAGNVWEWCADWYDTEHYARASRDNPTGPETGAYRVVRGGAWDDYRVFVRASNRGRVIPLLRGYNRGFRVACRAILSA